MMKFKIIFTALLTVILFGKSFAQSFPTDPETKMITYQEVVTVEGVSQADQYERAKKWLTTYYNLNKEIKEIEDASKLIKKGYFPVILTFDYKYKHEHTLTFNITLQHKDDRYRYILSDFMIYKTSSGEKSAEPLENFYPKQKHNIKTQLHSNFNTELSKLLDDMKLAIETGDLKNEDDW